MFQTSNTLQFYIAQYGNFIEVDSRRFLFFLLNNVLEDFDKYLYSVIKNQIFTYRLLIHDK